MGNFLDGVFNGGSAHSVGLVRPLIRAIGGTCPRVRGLDGSKLHRGARRLGGCIRTSTSSLGTGVTRVGTGMRRAPLRRHSNLFARVSGLRGRILRHCRRTLGGIVPRIFSVIGTATRHFTLGRRIYIATGSFSHSLTTGCSFIRVGNSATYCCGR